LFIYGDNSSYVGKVTKIVFKDKKTNQIVMTFKKRDNESLMEDINMTVKIKKSELKKLIKEELGKMMSLPTFSLLGGAKSKVWEQSATPDEVAEIEKELPKLPLNHIAGIIKQDWKNVWFGAKPYLDALFSLNSIKDNYGSDSGLSIVAYFLSNAAQWKGPVAKIVKKELKKRLKNGR
jgi:hypothetical protein